MLIQQEAVIDLWRVRAIVERDLARIRLGIGPLVPQVDEPERGEIIAGRQRIENETGAWEGTFTELQLGEFQEAAGWFIGEGAYDGLAAYVVTDAGKVWGVIRPDDGFGAPTAFADE